PERFKTPCGSSHSGHEERDIAALGVAGKRIGSCFLRVFIGRHLLTILALMLEPRCHTRLLLYTSPVVANKDTYVEARRSTAHSTSASRSERTSGRPLLPQKIRG